MFHSDVMLRNLSLLFAFVAMSYLVWNHMSFEHMTNADVAKSIKPNDVEPPTYKTQIRGPRVPEKDENEPNPTDSKTKKENKSGRHNSRLYARGIFRR